MHIHVQDTAELAGGLAADYVASLLVRADPGVLGVATGASPVALYASLAARVAEGLDLSRTTVFALDEYVGLDPHHPESYHSVVDTLITSPLRLHPARVHVPSGTGDDSALAQSAAEYEAAMVRAGGVDVQIIGIGTNGHIGFNEPGSARDSRTRSVWLAAETREANARFFGRADAVPPRAITQGLGTVLEAKNLVLVADGAGKAAIVRAALEGPMTADCPASFLQSHSSVAVFLDRDAASQLDSSGIR